MYELLGLLSPEEAAVLKACAPAALEPVLTPTEVSTPEKPSAEIKPSKVTRADRAKQPPADLLKPFGLVWMWKEARVSWEPQIRDTDKLEASLFDQSSHYLGIQIEYQQGRDHRYLVDLLHSLKEVRQRFEREQDQSPWAKGNLLKDLNRILNAEMNKRAN